MKPIQTIVLMLALLFLTIPTARSFATGPAQSVVDVSNLVQNIEHTLRTIHIEHQSLIAIAQRAKKIGQSAQIIINMQNQLMMAKRNLESLRLMIKTGKYRSIADLNALCFQVQRIGYNAENISTSFDAMFRDKYLSKPLRMAGIKKQEEEMRGVAKGAMATESEAIKENAANATNVSSLMSKSQGAVGVKSAVQVNSALLAELASQNMEIKKLLAMISRLNAMEAAMNVDKSQRVREENKRHMKDMGGDNKTTGIMTKTLQTCIRAFSFGYTNIAPEALKMLKYFIILEIFFFGILIMYTRMSVSNEAIKKFLAIGFYVWLIPNIELVSEHIRATFAQVGLSAGGNTITLKDMFDPSAIIKTGYDVALPLFGLAGEMFGVVSMALAFLTACVVFVCFLYISWVLFMTTIEYTIVTVAAVYLMPFSLFKPLQFLAERSVTAAFSIGIRFMIMGIAFCGTQLIIQTTVVEYTKKIAASAKGLKYYEAVLSGAYDLTYRQMADLIIISVTIAVIFFSASRISSVYFGGSSVLSGTLNDLAKKTAGKLKSKKNNNNNKNSAIEQIKKATSYA